jgi:predicted exporter
LETKIEWGVFFLYLAIVSVLGFALAYALYLGTNYTTFAGTIVTALTTIAGFAVGVNSGTPSSSTPTQKK